MSYYEQCPICESWRRTDVFTNCPWCLVKADSQKTRCPPYRTNPKRRLQRLRRLLEKRGGPPTFNPPNFPSIPHDYRLERTEELLGIELEWACKTAMLSIGGEW